MLLVHSFGVILLAIVYVYIYINYTCRLWCRKMQYSSNLYVPWMLCSLPDIIQHIRKLTNVHNLNFGKVITFRDFLEIWPLTPCWNIRFPDDVSEQNRFHGWKTPTRKPWCFWPWKHPKWDDLSMIWADIQYHFFCIPGIQIYPVCKIYIYIWLVLWMIFPFIFGKNNNPNWRTPSFFRGIETTNQKWCFFTIPMSSRFLSLNSASRIRNSILPSKWSHIWRCPKMGVPQVTMVVAILSHGHPWLGFGGIPLWLRKPPWYSDELFSLILIYIHIFSLMSYFSYFPWWNPQYTYIYLGKL